jgi:transposase-like protein
MQEKFEDMALGAGDELNINDPSQLHRWMQQWEVSERDLRMAVANVGTQVAELRIALGR